MACGDVLSLEDLQTAKKHQIFEAEVITGKTGGVASGASIDYAMNPVTGQVQKTLPAILRDTGFRPASFTFATGGTLAVGDSDVVVLWPISAGGDGQYYLWKGAYPKTIPESSSPATTGGVSDAAWLPWGDVTLREDLSESIIYVRMGQDVWDGITDNTAAVQAAHTAANLFNASVSYAGITKFAVQADAKIPVKTSVDFCGAELVIIGGVNNSPAWNTMNTLYILSDDACPLQKVTGSVAASDLKESSLFPTRGLFNGHGYARLTCGFQVPNRDRTGTQSYKQSFKINRNGKASLPLSVDLSEFASAIIVEYRKTSVKRLVIENLSLMEGAWNNQIVFKVSRCNVNIDNLTLLFTGGDYENVCDIIHIDSASDVQVRNYTTTGRPISEYALAVYGGADIRIDNFNALEGWGCLGCNDLNGFYVTNSIVNRVDCHTSGHNIFVDNCDIHQIGVVYGWGGGLLSVKNSRFYQCVPVSARSDWGGSFFGTIVVDGVEITNDTSSGGFIVDLLQHPLGASTPVYAPAAIEVSNVKRIGRPLSPNGELIAVAIKVRDASSVVYAPRRVCVNNVACTHDSWGFGVHLDLLNMEGVAPSFHTRVIVDGVYPTFPVRSESNSLKEGIIDYDQILTPTAAVRPQVKVSNADNIGIKMRAANFVDIRCSNVGLNAVEVNTTTPTKPSVWLDNCRLHSLPTWATAAVIGAGNSGTDRQTVLRNCDIRAAFDLSNVAAMSGNTIRTFVTQPTLPAGVTGALAFTGWQKPGVFS